MIAFSKEDRLPFGEDVYRVGNDNYDIRWGLKCIYLIQRL